MITDHPLLIFPQPPPRMCFQFCFGAVDDHDDSLPKPKAVPVPAKKTTAPRHPPPPAPAKKPTAPHHPPPPVLTKKPTTAPHQPPPLATKRNGHRAAVHHQQAPAAYEEDRKASNDARKGYAAYDDDDNCGPPHKTVYARDNYDCGPWPKPKVWDVVYLRDEEGLGADESPKNVFDLLLPYQYTTDHERY